MKAALVALALAAGAAGPALAQQAEAPARYDRSLARAAGDRPDAATDEGGLWGMAERLEREIQASGALEKDAALTAYVRDLSCRLTGAYCKDIRVYVLGQPVWNAFMAPNGTMALYAGLLLRMDDEAQLACVVGHEAGHFIQNHSLENFRALKNRANLAMIVSLGAAVAGAPAGTGDLVGLGVLASLMSYSRQHESEADRIGFEKIAGAGYDTRACATVWRNLLAEFEVSDQKALRRRADGQTGLLDSHPGAAERIAVLNELAAKAPARTERAADRYRDAVRPHLVDWLRADVRRKDFGGTMHFLDRRIAEGRDLGVFLFFKGEALRLRRKDGDLAAAVKAYEAAIAQPDAPAEAWREVGLIRMRDGDKAGARALLQTYLEKAPTAEDRLLIEADLKTLDGG